MPVDFKEEWPLIRAQLLKLSQEALHLAKRGEDKIFKLSKDGKKKLEEAYRSLRREHILYLIGKEYVAAGTPGKKNPRLKELLTILSEMPEKIRPRKKT